MDDKEKLQITEEKITPPQLDSHLRAPKATKATKVIIAAVCALMLVGIVSLYLVRNKLDKNMTGNTEYNPTRNKDTKDEIEEEQTVSPTEISLSPKSLTVNVTSRGSIVTEMGALPSDYLSPSGEYLFSPDISTYKPENGFGTCEISIYKKGVQTYEKVDENDPSIVGCYEGMGQIGSTSFWGWIDNSRLLLETPKGKVNAVNVRDWRKTPVFSFDAEKFSISGVDKTQNYWLLLREESGGSSFRIESKNNTIVAKDINFASNDNGHLKSVLYDPINNGFLFVEEKNVLPLSEDKSFVLFHFLSVNDFQLRNVLTTKPSPIPHRGCGGNDNLTSTLGEIKVFLGCVNVSSDYLDKEGRVTVKL